MEHRVEKVAEYFLNTLKDFLSAVCFKVSCLIKVLFAENYGNVAM